MYPLGKTLMLNRYYLWIEEEIIDFNSIRLFI